MSTSTWIAAAAVVVAVAALFYARRSANAAREQTKIQRQLREDAAQPYVWADLRPSEEHGQFILLVIGNSGPTLATDVQVSITPELRTQEKERSGLIHKALADGLSALAPGRTITWNLGVPWEVITKGQPNIYRIRIRANGPFGAVPAMTYSVDLETLRYSLAVPPGTLNGIAVAIAKASKTLSEAVVGQAAD
ncbi:hypothetical protein FOE78_07835 [Microlunatus elymi]|uniref:Uncharacterized protein n=1 Tax=Microlunatus elymi TaxID=2596828 RepID=A0A516PXE6_9ACTN|nr:hypothetical protein [Microlunatus elymi]QDP95822.1 hypothetical protein FOE78_07835 [Microlunatus elymi]